MPNVPGMWHRSQVVGFSKLRVLLSMCDGRIKEGGSEGNWMESGRRDGLWSLEYIEKEMQKR